MRQATIKTAAPSIELGYWYLAILVPTIVFKLALLNETYPDGLQAVLAAFGLAPRSLGWWAHSVLFFKSDLLEVFLGVVVLFLATYVSARSWMLTWVSISTFASVLVAGINLVCYRQIGCLLTTETLEKALRWAFHEPGIAREVITFRHLAILAVAVLWAVVPVALIRRARVGSHGVEHRVCAGLAAALLVMGAIAIAASGMPARSQLATMGFWSDSLLTLVGRDAPDLLRLPLRAPADLEASLRKLSFPDGVREPSPIDVPARARHVVIVALETAPRKYYPITRSEYLPTFHRMSEHAIVSDLHYAAAPASAQAVYSIISGTYPPLGLLPSRFGDFRTDGLAAVLGAHGYESTYVDSYTIDWADRGDDRMYRGLGFDRLVESADDGSASESFYERSVRRERQSFDHALRAIVGAAERGKKAFVLIGTSLGHYRWRAPPEAEEATGREKLARIVREMDGQVGRFLASLEARGLGNDVVIVITGDHGLRTRSEFESLDERFPDVDLTYNVPLLIYLPDAMSQQRRVDCPTSHVDLAPTLFDLLGIRRRSLLLHGENVLDPMLCARATFLTGSGLYPVDSLRWLDQVFTRNRLSGRAWITTPTAADSRLPLAAPDAARLIGDGGDLFDATAAIFLRRAAEPGVDHDS